MSHRIAQLASHVHGGSAAHFGAASAGGPAHTPAHIHGTGALSPSTVVILAAVRTPITKAKRGGFKSTTPDVLLRTVLSSVVSATPLPVSEIADVCVGNVLGEGAAAAASRMAQLEAGIPHTVPLSAVNRQCSSGLQAVLNIASGIACGAINAGIGAGVESMSTHAMDIVPSVDWDTVRATPDAWACTVPMGITNENVAERYDVSRADQDAFAARSHRLAAAARRSGAFREEIVPVATADADGATTTIAEDDGIREGTSVASLSKLTAAFKDGGSTTAGNSSQVSDGAAAVLVASAALAQRYGIKPLAVLRGWAVVGVPPDEMGIGPAFAIPEAVRRAGLRITDIGVFELNEAFAAQSLYCIRKLGLETAIGNEVGADGKINGTPLINPLGGAIALGHPLGCTGARQIATLVHFLQHHNLRYGVVSMCIGTGMGAAAVFERVE